MPLPKLDISLVHQLIRNRRTIKPAAFSNKRIEDNLIYEMLKNANWAPTHGLTEPWFFTVFCDAALTRLSKFHAELYRKESTSFSETKYAKIIARGNQSSHIIALGMKRGANPKIPKIEEIAAASCAVQNICLTATAMGIGVYWGSGGMTYHPAMKNFLNLSDDDETLGFLYLGYPAIDWPLGKRNTGYQTKVEWNNS